jgi:hypothetical protein
MDLTLCWQGPMGAGLFPEEPDDRSALDHDIIVTHDFSMLAGHAAAIVQSVIGVDSIQVPAAVEAFDHAD